MSSGHLHSLNKSGHLEGDFELNLAPIIDCFTVLITYLLVSASFIQISVMDIGLNGNGDPSSAPAVKKDPVTISMSVGAYNDVFIKVTGAEKANIKIAQLDGHVNATELAEKLKGLKTKWSAVDTATVSAQNVTEYKEIVKVVDAARDSFPLVSLGDD